MLDVAEGTDCSLRRFLSHPDTVAPVKTVNAAPAGYYGNVMELLSEKPGGTDFNFITALSHGETVRH